MCSRRRPFHNHRTSSPRGILPRVVPNVALAGDFPAAAVALEATPGVVAAPARPLACDFEREGGGGGVEGLKCRHREVWLNPDSWRMLNAVCWKFDSRR